MVRKLREANFLDRSATVFLGSGGSSSVGAELGAVPGTASTRVAPVSARAAGSTPSKATGKGVCGLLLWDGLATKVRAANVARAVRGTPKRTVRIEGGERTA